MPLHTQTCCCCRCCKCKSRWSEPSFKTLRDRNSSARISEELDDGREKQALDNNNSQSSIDSRKHLTTAEECSPASQFSSNKPARVRQGLPNLKYSGDSEEDANGENGRIQDTKNIRYHGAHHIKGHRLKKKNEPMCVDEKTMREMLKLRVSSEMLNEATSWQRQERLQQRLERIGALITASMVYSDTLTLACRAGCRVRRLLHVDTNSAEGVEISPPKEEGSPRISHEREEVHERITKSLLKMIENRTESESDFEDVEVCQKGRSRSRKSHQKTYSSKEIDAALEIPQALVQVMSVHRSRRKDFHMASNRLDALLVDKRRLTLSQLRNLEQQYSDVASGLCRSGELLEEHLPVALMRRMSILSSVIEDLNKHLSEISDEVKKMLKIQSDLCKG